MPIPKKMVRRGFSITTCSQQPFQVVLDPLLSFLPPHQPPPSPHYHHHHNAVTAGRRTATTKASHEGQEGKLRGQGWSVVPIPKTGARHYGEGMERKGNATKWETRFVASWCAFLSLHITLFYTDNILQTLIDVARRLATSISFFSMWHNMILPTGTSNGDSNMASLTPRAHTNRRRAGGWAVTSTHPK